ncbi:SPFH domain-containing protein [PVC group bacterium]|nr:SPFH domain-containing protein [PVC group bacterium]
MEQGQLSKQDIEKIQKVLGGSLIWVIIASVLLAIFFIKVIRIEEVTGEQTGFLLNKLTGKISVIENSGKQIFNGLTKEFYVLDKTLQTLEMSESAGLKARRLRDDLKIKTIDGSDVYVDLKVQYRMDANIPTEVLTVSGTGDNYKEKWARDYVRSICRNFLGELTTEEFYDSEKRQNKTNLAKQECNKRLKPFGIIIDSIVIPRRPHFYKEYEDMIKRKKEADQTVHAERSKALAAKQKQQTLIVQETNKKNVAVEQFEGTMKQKIIDAEAASEKAKKGAEAYYEQKTIAAEALLYKHTQEAEGILAAKSAEAAGIKALKEALEGEGGVNMVKLEYAKKLIDLEIIGKPFTIQSDTERFEHLKSAATTGRE